MSGETILITRPRGDEQAMAEALHGRGYRVIHEPLTDIVLLHDQRYAVHHALMQEPDAVIVTSRHGAQALSLLTEMRDMALLCVGKATALAAQSLGFTRISAAGGAASRLAEYIAAGYDEGARFLYISGKHIRIDLAAVLPAMQIGRIAAYDAVASRQISDTVIEQLKRRQIDAITFFSPRAAQIFVALLDPAERRDFASHLQAFCLSDAVAAPLKAQTWKAIHIAAEPTLASMVQCVDNAFI